MNQHSLIARRAAFALYLAATVAYLVWRPLYSLNAAAPLWSWAFYLLELYACLCSAAFYLTILERKERRAPPATPGRSVDVFICTYNESPALLRQTVRRALAMTYPHRTYLCDDGRRDAVKQLAAELGCGYLTRPSNEHFKAGNLNNALRATDGELVVVLDADHLVRPEFLDALLGYFDDPTVALVQTPQVFYNIDSFQHHFRPRTRRLWHEGAIFHHAMQPGADRWNAAFFVGTGAILRRSAVREVGGFATSSVTEDAFTCMRLHAKGFQSVYHDEPLAYLVAPESLHQYLTQRLRWGQGSMQILRQQNPLLLRGLSPRQRLVYFMALSSFAQAVVHLAYYLAPSIYLLTGLAPLRAHTPMHLLPIVAHVLVDLAMFRFMLGRLARPLLSECYKFLNVYAYLKALSGYFSDKRLKFEVTTKGRDAGASVKLLVPQILLFALNLAALGVGVIRLTLNPPTFDGLWGTLVALGFCGMFVVIGAMALTFAYERIAAHTEFTFPDELAVRVVDTAQDGVMLRANEAELHIVVPRGSYVPRQLLRLALQLEPGAPPLEVRGLIEEVGQVRSAANPADRRTWLRLALTDLSGRARDVLFDRFALYAMPRLVNALVLSWRTKDAPPPPDGPQTFLPLQSNVL